MEPIPIRIRDVPHIEPSIRAPDEHGEVAGVVAGNALVDAEGDEIGDPVVVHIGLEDLVRIEASGAAGEWRRHRSGEMPVISAVEIPAQRASVTIGMEGDEDILESVAIDVVIGLSVPVVTLAIEPVIEVLMVRLIIPPRERDPSPLVADRFLIQREHAPRMTRCCRKLSACRREEAARSNGPDEDARSNDGRARHRYKEGLSKRM